MFIVGNNGAGKLFWMLIARSFLFFESSFAPGIKIDARK